MNKSIDKHEAFVLDIILPAIFEQARKTGTHPIEVAGVVLGGLVEVAHHHGVKMSDIIASLREAESRYTAPGSLQ